MTFPTIAFAINYAVERGYRPEDWEIVPIWGGHLLRRLSRVV
jgi:hypothetical protein